MNVLKITAALVNSLAVTVTKAVKIEIGLIGIPQESGGNNTNTFAHGTHLCATVFSIIQ